MIWPRGETIQNESKYEISSKKEAKMSFCLIFYLPYYLNFNYTCTWYIQIEKRMIYKIIILKFY